METTAVFSDVSLIKVRLIFLLINAITSAPKAPMAAASVGVAIPAKIDPRTRKIKVIGSARVLNKSIKSLIKSYYPPRSKKIENLVSKLNLKKDIKLTIGGCLILREKNEIIIKKEKKN